MSTNIADILAQALGRQQPQAQAASSPIPSLDFGANGPSSPTPLPPEDLIVSPDPSNPRTPDQRMEGFRRLLTNFTYSLGSGLTAANQSPRGRAQRTGAGMGAILQVPEVLRRAQEQATAVKQKQAQDTVQLLLQAKQAETAALNQQSLAGYRTAQDANADATRDLTRTTAQKNEELKQQLIDIQKQTQKDKEEAAKQPRPIGNFTASQNGKAMAGTKMFHPPDADHPGGYTTYDIGPEVYEKAAPSKLLTPAEEAQKIRIAHASGVDPTQVVEYESEDGAGSRFGVMNKRTNQITPATALPGATVTPKLPESPAAAKTQGMAAYNSLQQVDNIEKILADNPQLVGPLAGRFGDYMRGTGTNPFAGTKDEAMGAQLSEHLKALFAQELRSLFPGRTNEQMQEEIRSVSPQMSQNPNIMRGYLEAIKVNQGIVLNTAKLGGWTPDIKDKISTGRSGAKITVIDPNKKPHEFDTQAQADAFKKAAGIK